LLDSDTNELMIGQRPVDFA